ncbi:putative membrane protein [Propionispora sp. 2/2-37]|nr:putative membrane protein [Propionispora sp. 2/2-37]
MSYYCPECIRRQRNFYFKSRFPFWGAFVLGLGIGSLWGSPYFRDGRYSPYVNRYYDYDDDD